jgi:hypothetical protein
MPHAPLSRELCRAVSSATPVVCRMPLHVARFVASSRELHHVHHLSHAPPCRELRHTRRLPHVDGGGEQELGVHCVGVGHGRDVAVLGATILGVARSPGRGPNRGRPEAQGGAATGGIVREGESTRDDTFSETRWF